MCVFMGRQAAPLTYGPNSQTACRLTFSFEATSRVDRLTRLQASAGRRISHLLNSQGKRFLQSGLDGHFRTTRSS